MKVIGDRLDHSKGAPRHVFMLGNLTSAVNKGKDVAAEFQSSSVTSLGEGLRQVSRDAADSLPMTIIRYLNRERTRSQQTRHMLRNVRCHHCPFRPGVEGSEPDGDGAPLYGTGVLRLSNNTREPQQRMCQNRAMARTPRNVRNRSVSDLAAWFRRRCDDDRLTSYRQVSECRLDSGRAMPSSFIRA